MRKQKAEDESGARAREGLGAGSGTMTRGVEQRQRLLRLLLAGDAISLDIVQFSYRANEACSALSLLSAVLDEFSAD
jgi:hypothetical protein